MMTNTLLLPLATAVLAASFAATTAPGGPRGTAPHDNAAIEIARAHIGSDDGYSGSCNHSGADTSQGDWGGWDSRLGEAARGPGYLLPAAGGGYDLSWHTIDGGGGTSSGGGFTLSGTIGQPDAGVMSGGDFMLAGGFWAASAAGAEPQCPVVGDINCDDVVDVLDLLVLLDAWGECADCGPPGGCPADLNGDCTVDVLDLLLLLDNWG